MISFNYETEFILKTEKDISAWVSFVILEEKCKLGEINYIFCDDNYLYNDTLTDIISFDYSVGKELHGDIYISIERVLDNAKDFNTNFDDELARVIIHGVLHYCGYKDKSAVEQTIMRAKENHYLSKRF